MTSACNRTINAASRQMAPAQNLDCARADLAELVKHFRPKELAFGLQQCGDLLGQFADQRPQATTVLRLASLSRSSSGLHCS